MEKIVNQTLLYDFYGMLLTKRQRAIYEELVFMDLSLSEVAEDVGITRQGVHDIIRRCTKIMEEYEKKLGLIKQREKLISLAKGIIKETDEKNPDIVKIKTLADQIVIEA